VTTGAVATVDDASDGVAAVEPNSEGVLVVVVPNNEGAAGVVEEPENGLNFPAKNDCVLVVVGVENGLNNGAVEFAVEAVGPNENAEAAGFAPNKDEVPVVNEGMFVWVVVGRLRQIAWLNLTSIFCEGKASAPFKRSPGTEEQLIDPI